MAERYLTAPLPKVGDAFATGDRGRWREERLEILGRLDDVVTVRGANVDLAAVRAVVADVVGVREHRRRHARSRRRRTAARRGGG